jgi:exopolyphosphatase/guanosine-5'-triphosphate,3'-diphosphate pyrophosphatase
MSKLVPRWEWRTFGEAFDRANDVLADSTPVGVEESDELYLLSEDGDNVKVRFDILDIKSLLAVDPRGLQQWIPTLKADFPASPADVETTIAALRLSPRALDRDQYTEAELLDLVAETAGQVQLVSVHKRRVRHHLSECWVELTDIDIGDRSTHTLAVEAEDPDLVWNTVTSFGVRDRVNTSVPRGLLALVRDDRPRYAVIDVGTNSVKFHVGEQRDDGSWQRVVDRAEVTRLGEGLAESGAISGAATARTTNALKGMVEEARDQHARAIVAVGTAGLRSAGNRDEVVAALEAGSGVVVEIISGEEESRLAYLAVRAELGSGEGDLVVFDTGGGSSQFTFGRGAEVDDRFSVDVGAARFTEGFGLGGAVSTDTLRDAMSAIRADLGRLDGKPPPDALVGMGGAITNMTAVSLHLDPYDPDRVQGATLTVDEVDRQIELYRTQDGDGRRGTVGLQPGRAEVILAGACIVRTVMDMLGQRQLTVSDRSLRHGLLQERFGSRRG